MRIFAALFLIFVANTALAADALPVTISTAKGTISLNLEVVSTPSRRAQGLMNRAELAPYDGMLFVFPRAERGAFWMKNTRIPLDMIFADPQGKIIRIVSAEPFSLTPIDSGGVFNTAIEIQAGRAAAEGIAVGDQVHFKLPEGSRVE